MCHQPIYIWKAYEQKQGESHFKLGKFHLSQKTTESKLVTKSLPRTKNVSLKAQ